jgi:hypothetical protein
LATVPPARAVVLMPSGATGTVEEMMIPPFAATEGRVSTPTASHVVALAHHSPNSSSATAGVLYQGAFLRFMTAAPDFRSDESASLEGSGVARARFKAFHDAVPYGVYEEICRLRGEQVSPEDLVRCREIVGMTRPRDPIEASVSDQNILAEQALRDHDPLHLVRPLVDLGDLRIAHESLGREVL